MTPTLRERTIQRAVAARYDLFLGVGAGFSILGLLFFVHSLATGNADRAWQLFHVNWIYFTGLAAGSVAFAAVQKITNAKWSGLIIRFAEAPVAFMPVSLVGLVLIFTAGYHSIYGPMEVASHGMQHSKLFWLSHDFMFARLGLGLLALSILGWKLVKADMIPDMYATRNVVSGGRRALFERWSQSYQSSPAAAMEHEARITGWHPSSRCCMPTSSPWWPSTASWRCSLTGSPTCWVDSSSWARSWVLTCCSRC
jgi:hypothetical protein